MNLGASIRAVLLADAATAAIVGTRIYPNELPQGCDLPAVVYQVVSDVPENSLTGAVSTRLKAGRVQVDSYARAAGATGAYTQAHALADAIESAIGDLSGPDLTAYVNGSGLDLYDNSTQFHRVSQDFTVWR